MLLLLFVLDCCYYYLLAIAFVALIARPLLWLLFLLLLLPFVVVAADVVVVVIMVPFVVRLIQFSYTYKHKYMRQRMPARIEVCAALWRNLLPTGRILYHTILFRFYYMSLIREYLLTSLSLSFVSWYLCLSACFAICDGACKVRSLVLYEFFRVFYALSTKICSPRVLPQQQQ